MKSVGELYHVISDSCLKDIISWVSERTKSANARFIFSLFYWFINETKYCFRAYLLYLVSAAECRTHVISVFGVRVSENKWIAKN